MAEYKKNNRMHGSRAFTTPSFASKELFDAQCNSCHKRCQVPFRPNGKKPVYCSDCFKKDDARPAHTSSYHSASSARPVRSTTHEASDRQLQELKREVQAMSATLKELVVTVDTFNRATALTLEIQKHFPKETPVSKKTPAKKMATKAAIKKSAKK